MLIEVNTLRGIITDFQTFVSFPVGYWTKLNRDKKRLAIITSKEENAEIIPPYFI